MFSPKRDAESEEPKGCENFLQFPPLFCHWSLVHWHFHGDELSNIGIPMNTDVIPMCFMGIKYAKSAFKVIEAD